jgi:hypothetical protein
MLSRLVTPALFEKPMHGTETISCLGIKQLPMSCGEWSLTTACNQALDSGYFSAEFMFSPIRIYLKPTDQVTFNPMVCGLHITAVVLSECERAVVWAGTSLISFHISTPMHLNLIMPEYARLFLS